VKPDKTGGDQEEPKPGKGKRNKNNMKAVQEALEEAKLEEKKVAKEEKVKKMMQDGGDVNVLDAVALNLTSPEIDSAIEDINKFVANRGAAINELLTEVRQTQLILNITPDYKYYILICGCFNPKRNIVKHWPKYEKAFLKLVQNDGELGPKRLFQAIVLFFINKYPEQKKFASSFCKLLYDTSVYTDEFFTSWHSSELRLDKNCILYDRKAEKQFRGLIDDFVEWLQYGEEEDPAENKNEVDDEEEPEQEAKEETEAQRNQRELIE